MSNFSSIHFHTKRKLCKYVSYSRYSLYIVLIVCWSCQEFSNTKESTLHVIWNVGTAFLLGEANKVNTIRMTWEYLCCIHYCQRSQVSFTQCYKQYIFCKEHQYVNAFLKIICIKLKSWTFGFCWAALNLKLHAFELNTLHPRQRCYFLIHSLKLSPHFSLFL